MQYITFLLHFDNCIQKRERKNITSNWRSIFNQLKQYDKWNTLTSEVDEKYCDGLIYKNAQFND